MGVVFIMLPPLRERKDELKELVGHFIAEYNHVLNVQVLNISKNVLQLFEEYHWPGNVRELKHVIEAAMNMVSGSRTIRCGHLPPHIFAFSKKNLSTDSGGITVQALPQFNSQFSAKNAYFSDLSQTQAQSERQIICDALGESFGNAAKAARNIGISPQSFHYKLKKHGLKRKDFAIHRSGTKKV